MAGGGGGGESGEPEFQIAPMIDVLLVLLIFFMSITSAEVLKVDKNIKLPVSPHATKRDPEMAKHEIAINLRWDGKQSLMLVDDREYPNISELAPFLKERMLKDPKLRAVVRGDGQLPAIEIQKLMTLVGDAGILEVSFAASNK